MPIEGVEETGGPGDYNSMGAVSRTGEKMCQNDPVPESGKSLFDWISLAAAEEWT